MTSYPIGENIRAGACAASLREGGVTLQTIADGGVACALGGLDYVSVHGDPKIVAALGALLNASLQLQRALK